jgi:hypothetical protein
MSDKIVGNRHQQAPKNIDSLCVASRFEIRLTKQSVGFEMFGEGRQNMATMGYRLIEIALFDESFYLAVVDSQ